MINSLTLKCSNRESDTRILDSEVDLRVYELYGLTEEEIAVVEGRGGA
jgi:adenine-specific DNA-methyltransferase